MAKTIHKKPLPKRPRNLLHAEMLKQGILRSRIINDERHKLAENRAKKRAMEFMKMNKENYDD